MKEDPFRGGPKGIFNRAFFNDLIQESREKIAAGEKNGFNVELQREAVERWLIDRNSRIWGVVATAVVTFLTVWGRV